MVYNISIITGDGIGPEISDVCLNVLYAIRDKFNIKLNITLVKAGDDCYAEYGNALPEETINKIQNSDVCIKAPVGQTAASVIVKLRQLLSLYANVRPAVNLPNVDSIGKNVDLVIVRENTEDLYKGYEFTSEDVAVAMRVISKKACYKISEYAFQLAELRNKKRQVVAIHKNNVLKETCGLFLKTANQVSKNYSNIKFSDMLVDAAAMNLIREPEKFDVILTTNMFGDILSDEIAQIVGGLGLAPSGNIGDDFAIFEPVHGSAPDIAGKGLANPIAIILSTKMMFEWLSVKYQDSNLLEIANNINNSVNFLLANKYTTPDIGGSLTTSLVQKKLVESLLNT